MTPERTHEAFRLWAFHAYYGIYREEKNLTVRFAKALVASSRPVSEQTVAAWRAAKDDLNELRGRQNEPATRLAPVAYWRAVFEAIRRHTGRDLTFRAWENGRGEEPHEPEEAWASAAEDDE